MWSSYSRLLYLFNRDKIFIGCLCKNYSFINCKTKLKFSSFKNSNTDVAKKMELIKMEHQVMLETGEKVPTTLSDRNLQQLSEISSYDDRKYYFNYLYKTEISNLNKKRKHQEKLIKREELLKDKNERTGDHLSYGLFQNSFLYFISNTRMVLAYSWLQLSALTFGQILVIDLDYDHLMSEQALKNTADQIQIAYGMNKISKVPWNWYICNAKPNSPLLHCIKNAIGHLGTPSCLVTVTEKSYLDIFPKANLIYITGYAPKVMSEFDHDAIYIIGGYVEKFVSTPASLVKAKKDAIKLFQLPLRKYLPWAGGRTTLAINQVVGILMDLKISENWPTALKHVPPRKLRTNYYGVNRPGRNTNRYTESRTVKSLFEE